MAAQRVPKNESQAVLTIDPECADLNQAFDEILTHFTQTHRLDHAHEKMQHALRRKLNDNGIQNGRVRMLEVNLFGSISGWMEFMLEERVAGRDVVPDFARHLRRAFLAHCREFEVDPNTALNMAVELATALMDLAVSFQRHMNFPEEPEGEA